MHTVAHRPLVQTGISAEVSDRQQIARDLFAARFATTIRAITNLIPDLFPLFSPREGTTTRRTDFFR